MTDSEREKLTEKDSDEVGELFNAELDDDDKKKRIQKPAFSIFERLNVDIDPSLIVYKAFYFFYFAALGSLQPYIALYFKHSLQLPAYLVGIVLGIRPFCLFVSAPILGTIADKYRKIRLVLIVAVFAYITYCLILTVVPPVNMSCLSEVNKKLNYTLNETHVLTNETKKEKAVKHAIDKHNKQQKDHKHIEVNERGNMDLWKQNWIYDVYTEIDKETYEKSKVIFAVVLTITVAGELLGATSNTLSDVAALQNLGNHPTDYGELRLWGEIGWGISAFITGNIVTHQYSKQTDICPNRVFDIYRPFFYVYAALMTIALFIATRFKFNTDDQHIGENCALYKSCHVFTHLEYVLFAILALFLGISYGVSHAFLNTHLIDLGATSSLLSALAGVHCLSNLTMYLASVYLIKKFGHSRLFVLGLAVYAVRFFYFSIIPNAWLVLPMELLSGLCQALVWCSLVSYVGTPPRIGATLQGILHAIYYGLGRGLGEIFGGILMRQSEIHFFRHFALVVVFVFLIGLFVAPIINARRSIWMSLSGYSSLNEKDNEDMTYREKVIHFWKFKSS